MPNEDQQRTPVVETDTPNDPPIEQETAPIAESSQTTTSGQQGATTKQSDAAVKVEEAAAKQSDAAVKMEEAATKAADSLPTAQQAGVQNIAAGTTQLSASASDAPQQIGVATNTQLLGYYTDVLIQSNKSFQLARSAALVGVVFFIAAVVFLLWTNSLEIGIVSAIGGAIVEVIAGLAFYLYGKATDQLQDNRRSMEQTQRFLLANSIANSSLGDDPKQKAIATLVNTISQWGDSRSQREDNHKNDKASRRETPRPSSRDRKDGEPNQ